MSNPEDAANENDITWDVLPDDTIKILVATDIHLGYKEKDPIRGPDSFDTFDEILQLGENNEVDFVLLGGNLFHESRPSPYCMQKCLELLRKYCLGNKPVSIKFVSDQSDNFQFQRVNYEDPNFKVSIPVFSIHGDHDDPTGHKQTSALDVIASTGLIHSFDRSNDLSEVELRPILLQKGITKLALYGLSHIKEDRSGSLFRDSKINLKKPDENDRFNMLVLHQNRAACGVKRFISDSALPDMLKLVIWGHEHECKIIPEKTPNGVSIIQPGSSIATSLAMGEAVPKKIGLLKIHKKHFKIIPLTLKTVRPFIIEELILESPDLNASDNPREQAISQVKDKIDEMIRNANSRYKESNQPLLPLLRLKVFYRHEQQQFNPVRMGMHFGDRVANPEDVIKLNSLNARDRRQCDSNLDEDDYETSVNMSELTTSVEDIVLKYFETDENRKAMTVLSVEELTKGVRSFVESPKPDIFNTIIDKQLESVEQQLLAMGPDNLDFMRLTDLGSANRTDDVEEVIRVSDNGNGNNTATKCISSDNEIASTSTSFKVKKTGSKTSTKRSNRRSEQGLRGEGSQRRQAGKK